MAISLEQQKLVSSFLDSIVKEMQGIMDTEDMNASGQSRASITFKLTDRGGILYGPAHIVQLERGRKPTSGGGNGSLKERIRQWINDKGIQPRPDPKTGKVPTLESLAFLITRAIHERGTVRWQNQEESGILSRTLTPERLEQFTRDAMAIATRDVNTGIQNEVAKLLKIKT